MISRMPTGVRRTVAGLALLSGFAVFGAVLPAIHGAAAAERRHLALVKSSPEKDGVLAESPAEIRLFFSEAPKVRGSTIRLTRGESTLIATTETAADPEDGKQLVIRPEAPLTPGSYTVHWRVIAQDDHAVQGTFGFGIATQE